MRFAAAVAALLAIGIAATSPNSAGGVESADENAELRVAIMGDGIVWGTGLPLEDKFFSIVADDLSSRGGKQPQVINVAHTGADLVQPANRDLDLYEPQQQPFCEWQVTRNVPTTNFDILFCQMQLVEIAAHEEGPIDLVIADGCMSDANPHTASGPPAKPADIIAAAAPVGVLANANITAAIQNRCVDQTRALVEKAHALPGSPRVVLTGYYELVSDRSSPVAGLIINVATLGTFPGASYRALVSRSKEWTTQYSALVADPIISDLDPAGDWLTFVEPGFGPGNALYTKNSWLWWGANDPMQTDRGIDCWSYLGQVATRTLAMCWGSPLGHPNTAGARSYAEAILADEKVNTWFPTT